MHVSSTVRDEAKKLFWSESTTRYHIYGYWLFSGGYPAHACHDSESLAYMQYIEVDSTLTPRHRSVGGKEASSDGSCKVNAYLPVMWPSSSLSSGQHDGAAFLQLLMLC